MYMRAIVNGKVYTMAGKVIENGTILIEAGKITAVGTNLDIPAGAEIIDAAGKFVMPGIIDAHTHIGVYEEGIGFEGADGNELTNPSTPHIRALDAINPMEDGFKGAIAGGVTSVGTGPGSGNVIGGQAIAIKTWGKVADDMIIMEPMGLKIAFGENPKRVYSGQKKSPSTRMAVAAILRENLVAACNYMAKLEKGKEDPEKAPDRDLKMEILVKVLNKEIPLRAHAHRADDIITAIRIAEEFNLDYSIEHATEGYKIADILAEKKIPCIVGPLLMGPAKHELWEVRLDNPAQLVKAGVKVAIQVDASSDTKYLGVQTGIAVREGLPMDEAFRCITINAAEILGLADRMGSLEVGKDADVAVFDGNPLCNFTNCLYTIIDGQIVYERNANHA
jgi:imidazolonepropionase-like amidohydrolase